MRGRPAYDLVGLAFEKLFVLERAANSSNGAAQFKCKCECDREIVVRGDRLREGLKVDCGMCRRPNGESVRKVTERN